MAFDARDENGKAIYHTNIMLSIGEKFVLVCADAIADSQQRTAVLERLEAAGRAIFPVSISQMQHSAGNILELSASTDRAVIVMSARARSAFDKVQLERLQEYGEIISADLNVIERVGGGSARCMLAEVHLPRQGAG